MNDKRAAEVLGAALLYIINNYSDPPMISDTLRGKAKKVFPQDTDQRPHIDEAMICIFGEPIFSKKQ